MTAADKTYQAVVGLAFKAAWDAGAGTPVAIAAANAAAQARGATASLRVAALADVLVGHGFGTSQAEALIVAHSGTALSQAEVQAAVANVGVTINISSTLLITSTLMM